MKQPVSTTLIPSALILLFSYTAFSKIIGHDSFVGVLQQIPVIAKGAGGLAWAIPLAELCCVLLLFFPATRIIGLISSFFLLTAFTLFLIHMVLFVPHLPCSCGGIISKLSWKQHIAFNSIFIGLTVYSICKLIAQTPAVAGATALQAG